MAEKQKIRYFDDKLVENLETAGLTYQEMMDGYGMTRWGARKVGQHKDVEHSKSGVEKIFFIDEKTDDLLNTEVPVKSAEVNTEEVRRTTSDSKQTITRTANTYLKQLESEVKAVETPDTSYEEPSYSEKGVTAIIHETDSHFSAHVKNREGNTVYDNDTAVEATENAFNWYTEQIRKTCESYSLDNIVILLGGDLVEGENIYEGQAHKVEDKLDKQIRAARKTYFEEITHLKKRFDVPVKIVCVSGNHGDLPVTSSSNADDIIYSQLEDMVGISDVENIKFVKSVRSDGVTFNYRGWKGYLTHGEHYRQHIGTSSPQKDWYATKDNLGFDAAWRGHYHNQKMEGVGGAPVYMTNSRKPADDYTDKISVYGVTGNAIYFATDDEPVSDVKTETNVLPHEQKN